MLGNPAGEHSSSGASTTTAASGTERAVFSRQAFVLSPNVAEIELMLGKLKRTNEDLVPYINIEDSAAHNDGQIGKMQLSNIGLIAALYSVR